MKSEIGILSGKVSETRYTSPELELLNVNAESGFATSNYGEPGSAGDDLYGTEYNF